MTWALGRDGQLFLAPGQILAGRILPRHHALRSTEGSHCKKAFMGKMSIYYVIDSLTLEVPAYFNMGWRRIEF